MPSTLRPLLALALLLAGLGALPAQRESAAMPEATIDPRVPAHVREALERTAFEHRTWGYVDSEARRAPHLCRIPLPPTARRSDAAAGTPHGEKLYGLAALAPLAYAPEEKTGFVGRPTPFAGLGQIVVKEAFHPRAVPKSEYEAPEHPFIRRIPLTALEEGDRMLVPDRPGPLFLMAQVPEGTPGSEAGWIYATFSRHEKEGTRLTALGDLPSCRSCHEKAPHGRLFGIEGYDAPRPVDIWDPKTSPQRSPSPRMAIDRRLPVAALAALERACFEYPSWHTVDSHVRRSPKDCFIPLTPLRKSRSPEDAPHGEKRYLLYARDADAYRGVVSDGSGSPRPDFAPGVGQVLVKETWKRVHEDPPVTRRESRPICTADGWLDPEDRSLLFLMLRMAPDTPATDEGWIYATADVNGPWPRLSHAGNLENCRSCHAKAGPDRQFGLSTFGDPLRVPLDPPADEVGAEKDRESGSQEAEASEGNEGR